MKKKQNHGDFRMNLLKIIRIMRLCLFLILLGTAMAYSADSYSQNAKLRLNFTNATVKEVIKAIEDQSEFIFFYQDQHVDLNRRVDIRISNKTIEEVLNDLFAETGNTYIIRDRQIVIGKVDRQTEENLPMIRRIIEPVEQVQPQRREITGSVKDDKGLPLPGVSVVVKGTTTGTITGSDGTFMLQVPTNANILVFSFVGYASQEVDVKGMDTVFLTMQIEVSEIDEIVAVGYATQKKVNLTGSVSSISAEELTKRPVTNVANLLQGKVTGLNIVQGSGQPGMENNRMLIRGVGTFSSAGNEPLVLIDGVQGDLTSVNADNVASVSVLKDAASAAIYGARAANGVILVTTKRGKAGTLNIDYHGNVQIQQPTRMPEFVTNSAEFMELWNNANARAGYPAYFTQSEIDAYRNATDRGKYPNTNWIDLMVHNSLAHTHHISANGGNEKINFNLALGFTDQSGIIDNYGLKKYDILLNIESKLNSVLTIGGNVGLIKKDISEPTWSAAEIMLMIYGAGPNYAPKLSDGSGRYAARYNSVAWHNRNPVSAINEGSTNRNNNQVASQTFMDLQITKGLMFQVKGAVTFGNSFYKHHEYPVPHYYFADNSFAHDGWPGSLGVNDQFSNSLLTTLYSILNYSKVFATNHSLKLMAGYNQESYLSRYLSGYRQKFPTSSLKELNAGDAVGQSTSGTANEWAIQSFFGRLNYDFKGKYLVESNLRYDGTSRMAKENRWGIFPSFSIGWRIGEEDFLSTSKWVDEFKLRASWGKLGNQNIGLYPYQEMMSLTSYAFETPSAGAYTGRLVDRSLTWEETKVLDFGLDLNLKKGLLTLTADWFRKETTGILYAAEVPISLGLAAPTVNFGEMLNKGIEFELGHSKQLSKLFYKTGIIFSSYRNAVTKIKAPSYGTTTIQEGIPWQSYFLTEWIGIFQNPEEISEGPVHPYNPKPGDLKFKDQNNDGKIDASDRIVVDGAHPDFTYGFTLNLSWKNLELSSFWQGVAGQKFYMRNWGIDPFMQGTAPRISQVKDAWTEQNPTNKYPAIWRSDYSPVSGTPSTFYLLDASYFRFKNLNITYKVPESIAKKAGMKNLKVYFSGDNLLTFTKYPEADPERTGGGNYMSYPQLRIFTFGLKSTF